MTAYPEEVRFKAAMSLLPSQCLLNLSKSVPLTTEILTIKKGEKYVMFKIHVENVIQRLAILTRWTLLVFIPENVLYNWLVVHEKSNCRETKGESALVEQEGKKKFYGEQRVNYCQMRERSKCLFLIIAVFEANFTQNHFQISSSM